jgi:hypothetical protein
MRVSGVQIQADPVLSRCFVRRKLVLRKEALMAKSPKKKPRHKAKASLADSCCPITADPQLRLASDRQTDTIQDNFPRGVAKPALRALFAAGLTTLDQLAQVSEAELAALHGMGPKALSRLRAALVAKGLDFYE